MNVINESCFEGPIKGLLESCIETQCTLIEC